MPFPIYNQKSKVLLPWIFFICVLILAPVSHIAALAPAPLSTKALADQLYHERNYLQAWAVYNQALQTPDPATQFNRALTLFQLGHYSQALQDVQQVLEQNPTHLKALFVRARLYRKLFLFHLAEQDFLRLQQLNPNFLHLNKYLQFTRQDIAAQDNLQRFLLERLREEPFNPLLHLNLKQWVDSTNPEDLSPEQRRALWQALIQFDQTHANYDVEYWIALPPKPEERGFVSTTQRQELQGTLKHYLFQVLSELAPFIDPAIIHRDITLNMAQLNQPEPTTSIRYHQNSPELQRDFNQPPTARIETGPSQLQPPSEALVFYKLQLLTAHWAEHAAQDQARLLEWINQQLTEQLSTSLRHYLVQILTRIFPQATPSQQTAILHSLLWLFIVDQELCGIIEQEINNLWPQLTPAHKDQLFDRFNQLLKGPDPSLQTQVLHFLGSIELIPHDAQRLTPQLMAILQTSQQELSKDIQFLILFALQNSVHLLSSGEREFFLSQADQFFDPQLRGYREEVFAHLQHQQHPLNAFFNGFKRSTFYGQRIEQFNTLYDQFYETQDFVDIKAQEFRSDAHDFQSSHGRIIDGAKIQFLFSDLGSAMQQFDSDPSPERLSEMKDLLEQIFSNLYNLPLLLNWFNYDEEFTTILWPLFQQNNHPNLTRMFLEALPPGVIHIMLHEQFLIDLIEQHPIPLIQEAAYLKWVQLLEYRFYENISLGEEEHTPQAIAVQASNRLAHDHSLFVADLYLAQLEQFLKQRDYDQARIILEQFEQFLSRPLSQAFIAYLQLRFSRVHIPLEQNFLIQMRNSLQHHLSKQAPSAQANVLNEFNWHRLLSTAQQALDEGNYFLAERNLLQAQARNPFNPQVYLLKSKLYFKKGDLAQSRENLDHVRQLAPTLVQQNLYGAADYQPPFIPYIQPIESLRQQIKARNLHKFDPFSEELPEGEEEPVSVEATDYHQYFLTIVAQLKDIFPQSDIESLAQSPSFCEQCRRTVIREDERKRLLYEFIEYVLTKVLSWEEYLKFYDVVQTRIHLSQNEDELMRQSGLLAIFNAQGHNFGSIEELKQFLKAHSQGIHKAQDVLEHRDALFPPQAVFSLGFSTNLNYGYPIFNHLLGLWTWESAYGRFWIYDTHQNHTETMFQNLIGQTHPVIFFIPPHFQEGITQKYPSVTYREIEWLAKATQTNPEILRNFYFVFDAYSFFPNYLLQRVDEVPLYEGNVQEVNIAASRQKLTEYFELHFGQPYTYQMPAEEHDEKLRFELYYDIIDAIHYDSSADNQEYKLALLTFLKEHLDQFFQGDQPQEALERIFDHLLTLLAPLTLQQPLASGQDLQLLLVLDLLETLSLNEDYLQILKQSQYLAHYQQLLARIKQLYGAIPAELKLFDAASGESDAESEDEDEPTPTQVLGQFIQKLDTQLKATQQLQQSA